MTPPHAHFKYLLRKHMLLKSRHSLDHAEARHSSTEFIGPIPEGSNSRFNQGLQPPEPSSVSYVDCTSPRSGSSHFSNEQATQAADASFKRGELEPVALVAGGPTEDRYDVGTIPVSLPFLPLPFPSLPIQLPSLPIPFPSPPVPHVSPSVHNSSPALPPTQTSTSVYISPVLSAISSTSISLTTSASLKSATTSLTSLGELPSNGTLISSIITSPSHTVSSLTVPIATSTRSSRTTPNLLLTTNEANYDLTSSLISSTSNTYNSSPSNSCVTSADGTSGCSVVAGGYPSGDFTLSQPLNSCADCSTPSTVSEYSLGITHVSQAITTTAAITTSLMPIPSIYSSTSTLMVSSGVPGSTSTDAVSTPPAMGAIAGGTIGAVAILGILIYIVMRCRNRKMFAVTPFDVTPTAGPTPAWSRNLNYGRMVGASASASAVRPNSTASSFVQYSDACLAEFESRSGFMTADLTPSASFMPTSISDEDEDDRHASASTVARRHRTYELEKLYPSPRVRYDSGDVRTTGRYDSSGGENWVEQMVTANCSSSREPSEELPAYPRSAESLKSTSREVNRGRDGHFVFRSSFPSLPETMHL
ncbi:hypothetical protein K503DRAFT_800268 [Rhizopogon vinicolor AM-OR11-026]|uniref:Uncharacterized protein n=1 Tax=Rhizopogon vinicolor AM-OR11-026 TaxID=1314800 RepID=A0A1B7N1B8_9AGAM|nr:hypothetical protein K503DRAFT_800268 [Rhizopogon vinicolor AM-OR11-026]